MTVYRCDICREAHEAKANVETISLRVVLNKLSVLPENFVQLELDICRGKRDCIREALRQITATALAKGLEYAGIASEMLVAARKA